MLSSCICSESVHDARLHDFNCPFGKLESERVSRSSLFAQGKFCILFKGSIEHCEIGYWLHRLPYKMKFLFSFFILFPLLAQSAFSEKPADQAPEPADKPMAKEVKSPSEPITKQSSVIIAGNEVEYEATTGKTVLRDDKDKPIASIFYTSYIRTNVESGVPRPVMFAFNGGPGSSSVWLHLGMLGPRRIEFNKDGTKALVPPARLIDNEFSILDKCDLVFIDPVSTGYSRAAKETSEKEFHGLDSDVEAVGDFIRIWLTENKRWSSPKYLCGESYGGIRAAGLSEHLQSRFGMHLNGVILLSALLDFRTLLEAEGSQLSYQIYLPAFAVTAHYHGKVSGNRDNLLKRAKQYAYNEYGTALVRGVELDEEELMKVAVELSSLTSIPADVWKREKLRLSPSEFRAELLRSEGKVIGRFDARVARPAPDAAADRAEYDPSFTLAIGAFSTAMLAYLSEELSWIEDQPYEVLNSVWPWDYGSGNRIVNMTGVLSQAMRDNPHLRVLVMGAYTDLATPPEGVEYSFRQAMKLTPDARKNVTFRYYEAGHMFYMNVPDLKKAREDLLEFVH